MTLRIDHLVICLPNLAEAAQVFLAAHHLVAVEGGRHPGHGTANLIVPLGVSYLELVSVVEADEGGDSPFGRWVKTRSQRHEPTDALCLRTDDMTGVCQPRGLEPFSMSRVRPDGKTLEWSIAGLDEALTEGMQFFIEWHTPATYHPGRDDASPGQTARSVSVELSGDVGRLADWVGGVPDIDVVGGPPAISSAVLELLTHIVVL